MEHAGRERARKLAPAALETAATPAAAPAVPPNVAGVLALQRSAGNQATLRMLSRKLTVKRADLEQAGAGAGANGKGARPPEEDQFIKLCTALDAYPTMSSRGSDRVQAVQAMLVYAERWIERYAEIYRDPRLPKVRKLQGELTAELKELIRGEDYLRKVKSQQDFFWQSSYAKRQVEIAQGMAAGKASGEPGDTPEAVDIMKKRGLTDADLAAIRIYSADEFKYVNPALAGKKGKKGRERFAWPPGNVERSEAKLYQRFGKAWQNLDPKVRQAEIDKLNEQREKKGQTKVGDSEAFNAGGWRLVLGDKDWAQMRAEGREHGRATVTALKKLAPYGNEKTYRGEQLTKAEANARWKEGKEWTMRSLYSSSRSPEVGMHFAQHPPNDDKPVKVFITIRQKTGRDISALSTAPPNLELAEAGIKGEEEVLFLPGTRFKVKHVDKKHRVWRVDVEEVAAGGRRKRAAKHAAAKVPVSSAD
jgi:hypothetical protein